MTPKNRRRPYRIVMGSHQYRFLAIILVYNLIIVGFLAIVLFVPDIISLHNQDLSIEVRAMAAEKILTLHSRVWPTIIAMICLMGLHSFRVFNRFIGPLYRFTIVFRQIRDGYLDFRVNLRKRDYLHKEAAILNEMIETINKKLANIQETVLETSIFLNKLESDDEENLTGLRQCLDELSASANYFKT